MAQPPTTREEAPARAGGLCTWARAGGGARTLLARARWERGADVGQRLSLYSRGHGRGGVKSLGGGQPLSGRRSGRAEVCLVRALVDQREEEVDHFAVQQAQHLPPPGVRPRFGSARHP